MKRLLLLLALLLPSPILAEGPLFRNKDTLVNQEFDNVYQDLRAVRSSVYTTSSTVLTNTSDIQAIGNTASHNQSLMKILQVVSSTTTTPHAEATASYSDTGLSATITLKVSTDIVVVLVSQYVSINAPGTGTNIAGLKLVRGSTGLLTSPVLEQSGSTPSLAESLVPLLFVDLPGSGSSLTYKTQIANVGGTATSVIANNNPASNASTSSLILVELGQ